METMAWFVGAVAMLPVFGITAWLRFASDPIDDDLLSVMDDPTAGQTPYRLH